MKKSLLFSVMLFSNVAVAADIRFERACDRADQDVQLSFIGDILPHESLQNQAAVSPIYFRSLWSAMEPLIGTADIAYGNMEGPTARNLAQNGKIIEVQGLYDKRVYSGTNMIFNFHPQLIDDLQTSGFDILGSANNHALDRGWRGLNMTVDALAAARMPSTGIRRADDPAWNFTRIVQARGFRIAYISCAEMLNGWKDPYHQVLMCFQDQAWIIKEIQRLKTSGQVDAVIVLPHWGDEYKNDPAPRQVKGAKVFVDAGADMVIGSHPHVLQRWEKMKAADGREALVVYSLGNFTAGQGAVAKRTSAQVFVSLGRDRRGSWIQGATYVPLWQERGPHMVRPMDVSRSVPREAQDHVARLFGRERQVSSQIPINTTPECR